VNLTANWRHLQAFVWLRWRIMRNQARRAGTVSAVLMIILVISLLGMAIPAFLATLLAGLYFIPRAAPEHLMYAWDALVLAFLFFWTIGLIVELQRSEPLALAKFLHLPVSVGGAFLINYLSSLVRLSLVLFGPVMIGFALALIGAQGLRQLFVLPLLAGFLLMVTALTYQLQGWLGLLMTNPRRRRTAIVTITVVFVLVAQLPNLLNIYVFQGARRSGDRNVALNKEITEYLKSDSSPVGDAAELNRGMDEIRKRHQQAWEQADRAILEQVKRAARLANLCVPIGWLPLGVMEAAEGGIVAPGLCVLGLALVGSASLWRAYRVTVRQYQGQANGKAGGRQVRQKTTPVRAAPRRAGGRRILETRLAGLSEPVSAIALGGFCTILRAPESKMILLTPVFMLPALGSVFLMGRSPQIPVMVRPLFGDVALVVILFGLAQLMINQFGFDRDGFRVFVLSAAPRRDILLGKNLAVVPVGAVMALVLVPIVQYFFPMRLDHLLALVPQAISMYLLQCILSNWLSIHAPFFMPAGTMKPANVKASVVFLQLLMFLVVFPLIQGLTILPLGIEALCRWMDWVRGVPVCLLLSLAGCALAIGIYRLSLGWLGQRLQAREQRILEIVATRAS
jgi:hypothetical protein